jgi:hypothetical protein
MAKQSGQRGRKFCGRVALAVFGEEEARIVDQAFDSAPPGRFVVEEDLPGAFPVELHFLRTGDKFG